MQDIWVSLHSIRSRPTYFHGFVSNGSGRRNFSYDVIDNLFTRRTFKILLDILGYRTKLILGLFRGRHAYKASLRSVLPDSLQLCSEIWVFLHFV
jgi:hypothetical protein